MPALVCVASGHGWLSGAYTMGTLSLVWGRRIRIQIRHAQLKYLSVGLKLKLTGPSDLILSNNVLCSVPNLMEALDSGHTTVKTENSQPGLSQGQDPSSRGLLRRTRVASWLHIPSSSIAVDGSPFLNNAYVLGSLLHLVACCGK
jgi:hypothetical protein